jgi:hypothetical protein
MMAAARRPPVKNRSSPVVSKPEGKTKMSDTSFRLITENLFALITVVCYIALVTSGLIAILDRPTKPYDSFTGKREPANAKRSIFAALMSRLTVLFHLKDRTGNGIQLAASEKVDAIGRAKKYAPRYRASRRFPRLLRSGLLALRLGFKSFEHRSS